VSHFDGCPVCPTRVQRKWWKSPESELFGYVPEEGIFRSIFGPTSSTGLDPFGKATFAAGGATLGAVAWKDSVASISTAKLPVGSTTITATYGGAKGFSGSSASLTQGVQPWRAENL
jgi:hypothetical protein